MDVNTILELDPNKEHEIIYDGYYEWKHCYFQFKNKSNADASSSARADSSSKSSLSLAFFSGASRSELFAHATTKPGISSRRTAIAAFSSPTNRRMQARRKPAFKAS